MMPIVALGALFRILTTSSEILVASMLRLIDCPGFSGPSEFGISIKASARPPLISG